MKPLVSCLSAAILMNLLAFGANAVTNRDLVLYLTLKVEAMQAGS